MRIRQFEEISNNAWPALQTFQYDGWQLRFANGVTKRSNSVNLLYPSTLKPEKKIAFCEELFVARNITPTFKITAIADPPDIDDRLEELGYYVHSTLSFQRADLRKKKIDPDPGLTRTGETDEAWIAEFIRMNMFDPDALPTYKDIMEQVMTPKCLISISEGKKTTGVGLAVLEGTFLGLFDIVIDKKYRGRGLGTRLVNGLLEWGISQGAETAYLQVLTGNLMAQKLYSNLGFKEIYLYWYRMKKIDLKIS
jgi:RimJ/RimL family protein N-acetyltransferase